MKCCGLMAIGQANVECSMERFEVSGWPVRGLSGPTAHAFEAFKKNTAIDNFLITGVDRIVGT
jgi:hypothetical protein